MYEQFYGLSAPPFELTTSPRFLFLSPGHREALSTLEYGLSTSKAITLLLGEAGTGKTTLVKAAMASERCRHVNCVILQNPALTRGEFLETLGRQFGLGPDVSQSKSRLLAELEALLLKRREQGETIALVVDEAQSLSHELLEEVRLLANIESDSHKLIPVVLAGQPELADRLNEPRLRQLKQRVALRCEVDPFTLQETGAYIASRIQSFGGEAARLFTREAVIAIHERSHGIPRVINVICDNALLSGMAQGRRPVGQDVVLEVCDDFDLGHTVRRLDPRDADAQPWIPSQTHDSTSAHLLEREDGATAPDADSRVIT
jgi:general secretion pathway protein A